MHRFLVVETPIDTLVTPLDDEKPAEYNRSENAHDAPIDHCNKLGVLRYG